MQIYIKGKREKQLRDYASSHSMSMSSVIDKSLELLFTKNQTVELIPPQTVYPPLAPQTSPGKHVQPDKPRSILDRVMGKKETIPFD